MDRGIDLVSIGRGGQAPHRGAPCLEISRGISFEESPAGEHFIENEAQRIQVRLLRDGVARQLFRRHVRGCSRNLSTIAQVFGDHGESEVGDARLAATVEHDVRRFEVTMDDSESVSCGEAGADFPCDVECFVGRKFSDAPQQRREVLAVDVLHG